MYTKDNIDGVIFNDTVREYQVRVKDDDCVDLMGVGHKMNLLNWCGRAGVKEIIMALNGGTWKILSPSSEPLIFN